MKLKSFKDEELGLDFTSPNVNSLKKIIEIIKEKELNDENCGKLLYIISDKISFGKNAHREKNDGKLCEEEVQLKKSENNNESVNNKRNDEENNLMIKLNYEDVIVETLDKNILDHIPHCIEYDTIKMRKFYLNNI